MSDDVVTINCDFKIQSYDPYKGYNKLARALEGAFRQAADGKGKERHADDKPFEDQKILTITRLVEGSPVAPLLYQVAKKAIETARMEPAAAIRELRGCINYAAAAIIRMEEIQGDATDDPCRQAPDDISA